jgi:hypothetical protein
MASIIVNGIKFNIVSENGFIVATNDMLDLKYIALYNKPLAIDSAEFGNEKYTYIRLKARKQKDDQEGQWQDKQIDIYLISSVLYDTRDDTYDLRGDFLRKNTESRTEIAELQVKIAQLRIDNYYYQIVVTQQLKMLAHIAVKP